MRGLIEGTIRALGCVSWVLLFFFNFWMVLSAVRVFTNLIRADYHEMLRSAVVAVVMFGFAAAIFALLLAINERSANG